mmetsp:Transcript_15386/g.33356  ORF Transcript_15386/g.33356 Transcript_15386/m.33356 type:complete len:89 (-) Transcript_15386:2196-2462(-)
MVHGIIEHSVNANWERSYVEEIYSSANPFNEIRNSKKMSIWILLHHCLKAGYTIKGARVRAKPNMAFDRSDVLLFVDSRTSKRKPANT